LKWVEVCRFVPHWVPALKALWTSSHFGWKSFEKSILVCYF